MSNKNLPNSETTDTAMILAFEHHTLHRKVLLKKLEHARTATKESLQEIDKLPKREETSQRIGDYDKLWIAAIKLFEDSYVSDTALEKLENVLLSIPQIIKKYYDALISKDLALQKMMKELVSDKYTAALELIKSIQSDPCPMSNLEPDEFDADLMEKYDKAFKFPLSGHRLKET